MSGGAVRLTSVVALAVAALGLAACSDGPSIPKIGDLNPFKEKQVPLAGKRIPIMEQRDKLAGDLAVADRPIVLPVAQQNEAWAQPGGVPSNAPGHLALASTLKQAWSADAGSGSSSSGRLMASPVVYDGRVYTLDAASRVSGFAIGGGGAVWRVSIVPAGEREKEGFGGGLAADNGRLYATTGFGTVVALDPKSGKKLWEKNVGLPIRAAPTAVNDRVYIVTRDGHAICLSGADGSEVWNVRGIAQTASLVNSVSPAVDGDTVVVPYPSGDVVAVRVADGGTVWTESLARQRTVSQLTALADAARPAIDAGVVYAVGHAGRMVATQQRSGERLWQLNLPGTQTPWVAGEAVYVVDTSGQLIAIDKRQGKILWTTKLPGATSWSGPTLAGDRLWVASNKGQLVGVEATTGKISTQQDLGSPVYIAPIVAQRRMFVLTDNARLISLN